VPSWTIEYEADALPENSTPAWTRVGVPTVYTAVAGILTTNYNGAVVSGTKTTLTIVLGASLTGGATMVTRARNFRSVNEPGSELRMRIFTGSRRAQIIIIHTPGGVSAGTIALEGGSSTAFTIGTLRRFRITIDSLNVTRLYSDFAGGAEVLLSTGTGIVDATAAKIEFEFVKIGGINSAGSVSGEWDKVYFTDQGAFTQDELPDVPGGGQGAGQDICRIPERIHTLLDAREPWSSLLRKNARPREAAYRIEWDPAYHRPFIFTWIQNGRVRRGGPGAWLHTLRVISWVAFEDLDQPDVNRMGRLEEDYRAMLKANIALNELGDIHRANIAGPVRKVAERTAYPYDILEVPLDVVVERRFTESPQVFTAGNADPGEVASSLRAIIADDSRFAGVKTYGLKSNQPDNWPAAFVTPGGDSVRLHTTGDHHWTLPFTIRFEERALRATPSCTLYRRVLDLEDLLQEKNSLDATRGVRIARVVEYKHLFGDRAAYPYDAAEVMVEVETDQT